MNARTHRIVVPFGLAVPCAVALAGGAQAATRPDDRGGSIGVGATQAVVAMPDVFERADLRESRDLVRPDDRAGTRGPGSAPFSSTIATSVDGSRGWDDALFGAAAVLGIVLLGAGAAITLFRRHRLILR